jgi:amino acid adenylation domain-containing protein/FkbM family methyltransferase
MTAVTDQAAAGAAPRIEAEISRLWLEALGGAAPTSTADFFAAGGTSIQAAGLVAQVCERLQVELTLAAFLEQPTLAGLGRAAAAARPREKQSPAVPGREPPRASLAQERFYFIHEATRGSAALNVPWAVRLRGPLDGERLERALTEIVRRHDTLRTRFELVGGQPVQVVESDAQPSLERSDVSAEPDPAVAAERLCAEDAGESFDLGRSPLLRARLIRLGADDHVLLLVAHHIVCDDWTKRVLLEELGALYTAFTDGSAPALPEPAIRYGPYAELQRARLEDGKLERELDWWRAALDGAPPSLELPTDRPRPPTPTTCGARLRVAVPGNTAATLRSLGRSEGATFFMTMLAAFEALLYRYTGQEDLVIGTAVDNRGRVELEGAVGLFTNVLAIRGDLSGSPSFRDLVARARDRTRDAIAHQELPFDRIAAALGTHDPSRHPVFQAFFEFIVPAPVELALPDVESEPFLVRKDTTEFDLGLYLDESFGRLDAVWEYSTDLFDPETIERLGGHFNALLDAVAAEPQRPLHELSLLSEPERERVLDAWNATAAPIPEARVEQLFEERTRLRPELPAVAAPDGSLSYSGLNERANQVAHLLRELGVGASESVGLCVSRSTGLLAGLLGILKAGASYVPINPEHPAARLERQLRDADVRALVTDAESAPALAFFDGVLLDLDRDRDRLVAQPGTDLATGGAPADPAYVLYTSGSTGVPKGVVVTQRNLVNYSRHMLDQLGGESGVEGLRFAAVSAISTDLGNTAIFPALIGGGCVDLVDSAATTDGSILADHLSDAPVDVLKITPSHLRALLDGAGGRSILPRRWLVFGGEALAWDLAEHVARLGDMRILNHYGPTEATVGCCTYEVEREAPRAPSATVPIGRPIANARAYVVDAYGSPVPVGVPGELHVGGAGVAVGYVGQEEQTARSFVPDPFAGVPGARMYRTGDLVRRLADGNLEFLGRIDEQVKIRGYRVEPAEVEAAIARQNGVRQAAVLVLGEGDDRQLAAGVVADPEAADAQQLRTALAEQLPSYMVPASIQFVEALPFTPSGKVNRRALLELFEQEERSGAGDEPETELERRLAEMWAELLDRERIGVDESFFEAGGHSLLAIRLLGRLRTELDVKLTIKALIQAPTIRGLAATIEAARAPAQESAPVPPEQPREIVPVPRDRPLRVGFAQEQLWLVDQLTPGSAAYNFSWPLRLRGRLDTEALERAAAALVSRHETLRTRFVVDDGQPRQVVDDAPFRLSIEDVSASTDPQAAAAQLVEEETRRPFDLGLGPLLRMRLIRVAPEEHLLQIVVHHIVFDGISKVVLYRELGRLYDAFSTDQELELPALPVQYGDFAEWERSNLEGGRLGEELDHWATSLEGAPTALDLATDRPRPAVASLRGSRLRHPIAADLRALLERLAQEEGATFFMVVLAAFEALLSHYSRQDELVVGVPVDTRGRPELDGVIGPFLNTLVVRADLTGAPSFRTLLARVRERTLDAISHRDVPFERLVEKLQPERDLSRHPLFQVLLALNPPEPGLQLAGLEVEELDPAWANARVDLFLVLDDLAHGLDAVWEYSSDLFDRGTIERMGRHFVLLLEAVVADPDVAVGELSLVDEAELQSLAEWNRTETELPEVRLEGLVARQAAISPDRVAVRFEGESVTFGELELRSNRLANHLLGLGVRPEDCVAVWLRRSPELVVGLLGILKAGAAYVPVDPTYPADRQQFMLENSGVRVILTAEDLLDELPPSRARLVCVDRDRPAIEGESAAAPGLDVDAESLAYVIYTSGSTGVPKGVEVPHRALVNHLLSMQERPGLGAEDVLVAVTTLSFDIAGLELFLPLITGAVLVIAPEETAADPRRLEGTLDEAGATAMQATPTTWRMLVDAAWPGKPGFKALCGGEALPPALAEELLDRQVELWNMYGPTETTIWSSIHQVRRGEPVTIGRPIANTTLHVLDAQLRPVAIGAAGELCIGGAGLARGYRNRPDLTAERFVSSPTGERLYRTGDLARFRPDGTIVFLGRLDDQVKVRGFRIELGEVEAALARHPSVAASVAAAYTERPGEAALAVYVVPRGELTAAEVRAHLAVSLPGYMVPSSIVLLEAIPLTPNGKVDRKALPAPDAVAGDDRAFVPPEGALEEQLAAIWAELLGRDRVGVEDNFFELGGHSLLAARMVGRVASQLEVELPLRAVFEQPTVRRLARRLDDVRHRDEPEEELPPLVPVARTRQSSFAQERFWFMEQLDGASGAYNISWPVRLRGALDTAALVRSLNEVVGRHEVLRTRYVLEGGRPVQVVDPPGPVAIDVVDLTGDDDREGTVRRLVDEQTRAPFDLEAQPPLRVQLARLAPDDHVLQVVVHHVAADGASKAIFFGELAELYGGGGGNLPAVQYGDYAEWQRSWLRGERLETELEYWRSELAELPSGVDLPFDRPRPKVSTFGGRWLRTRIGPDLRAGLERLATANGATPFMVLLAAFDVLVHRYSGQVDLAVGVPVDARNRAELAHLVGPLVNTVVLRADLSGSPTFSELVARTRTRTIDALEHQGLPFERLIEELHPERDLGMHPLFQVMLALNAPQPIPELDGLEVEELQPEKTSSRLDLTLILEQGPEDFEAVWEYSTDLFDPETIESMARAFDRLLEEVVEDPDRPIGELLLLDEAERASLLAAGNLDAVEFPSSTIHELFEAQAARTPERVAVTCEGDSLTYAELNERANRVANRLRALGVGPETPVALLLERSLDLVVAVLAVLKAGGGYVPLDPESPAERLAFVLEDTHAPVLVTQRRLVERIPEHEGAVLCLDSDPAIARESTANPEPSAVPGNLAYVIYTSGSTGRPKGVMVEHRNVARLFAATDQWFRFGPDGVWTLLHSYAFDFSVWELWGALLHGGRVVVVPHWTARSPGELTELLAAEGVTFFNATPSLFLSLQEHLLERSSELTLRTVVFGGEALRPALLSPWFERFGRSGPELVNMYGITETTVHVTYRRLSPEDCDREGSPIGIPIPDLQVHVLDERLEPVPVGSPGELFVGGAGVARGYLNRPELTSERFLESPVGSGRLYRTGDRARRRRDGTLEFEGRVDDQVKIRGFRIELGEIEAVLSEHEAVASTAVVAYERQPEGTSIAAYVVPDPARAPVVARFLRLERESALEAQQWRELPNRMLVAQVNQRETDYLYSAIFERREYLAHELALPEDACVFDVGANIGMFSLFVAQTAPRTRIFAFEPIPEVFELLRLNSELHGLDSVLLDCGLAAAEGTASFTYFPRNSLVSGRFARPEDEVHAVRSLAREAGGMSSDLVEELMREVGEHRVVERPLRTLSSVIAEHRVERIDLLKMDVERSEQEVLAGLSDADWAKVRQIVVEVHGGPARASEIGAMLSERGFAVAIDTAPDEVEQGLVYGRREPLTAAPTPEDRGAASPSTLQAELRSYLRAKLPEYMLPSSIVLVEALPLTENGKLDRRALPAPRVDERPQEPAELRTPAEKALAAIWAELLGVERIGRDDNFFLLGGHSLLVAQLSARLREQFGVAVSVREIFKDATLVAIARLVDSGRDDPPARPAGDGSASVGARPRPAGAPFPLSYSQEQLWLIDQWDPGAPTYAVALPFRVHGPLDVEAMRGALERLVERHEALRTTIVLDGETPVPVLRERTRFELPVLEASDVEEAERIVHELAARPFDFSRDLLLRATVIRIAEEDHLLLLETHHIAFDGWSEAILFDELEALYRGVDPPEPELQFGDFALWQRQHLSGEVLDEQLTFWRRYLAGAPVSIDLPFDHPRQDKRRFEGGIQRFELPAELAEAARTLSRDERVTPFILLLAALATLLYRITGQDDVLIGSPFANRPGRELESVVGFFSNTLVFRARTVGNPTFRQLLARVRELAVDVYAHHDLPFEKIVEAVRPQRQVGVNPLFQVNLRVRSGSRPELSLAGVQIESLMVDVGLTRFDLALDAQVLDDGIDGYFRYNRELFEPETVARIAESFADLLREALADPDRRLLAFDVETSTPLAPASAPSLRGFRKRTGEESA